MKIRNESIVLSLPATAPNSISNKTTQALTLYADNLLDVQIFNEFVKLINSKKLSSIEILKKLESCNSEY